MREEDVYLALQRYMRSATALANARAHEVEALQAETDAARLAYQNVVEAVMLGLDRIDHRGARHDPHSGPARTTDNP